MGDHRTTRCHLLAAWPCAVLIIIGLLLSATSARAQSGFFVEAAGDYSPVQIGTANLTWQSARLSAGFLEEGQSGWTVTAERQKRVDQVDWTASASGFRRNGDWTVSGGAGVGLNPSFSYRQSYEGELARRVAGTLVAHGGYRFLQFASTTVHVVQPGATLYMPRGEFGARWFIVHNSSRGTNTGTLVLQGSADVHPRLRVGGGAAMGERIFDIASLSTPDASSWVGFGFVHIVVNPAWSIDVGAGRAHENPLFSQTTFTIGVRRALGGRR